MPSAPKKRGARSQAQIDADPRRLGRPSWYRPEHAPQAERLALLGMTNDQMAAHFGVDQVTLSRWMRTHLAFRLAIGRGREEADGHIAYALYNRAKGYSHEAVKILKTSDDQPLIVPYTQHYPPDTAAASLWLRNRRPRDWRERTETAVSGSLSLEAWVLASYALPAEAPVTDEPPVIEGRTRLVEGE